MDTLINKGITIFNDELSVNEDEKTIVVLGSARGGTSIAAGVLYHLGIEMHNALPPVFEDAGIAEKFNCFLTRNIDLSEENQSKVWAFKRPSAVENITKIHRAARNPYYICVFRDPLAIANRNKISINSNANLFNSMENALKQYKKIIDFAASCRRPILMCSVEKIRMYPTGFVEAISNFVGLERDNQSIEAAVAFINNEPAQYLAATRKVRSIGAIISVQNGLVAGWASWLGKTEVARVDVILNGRTVETLEANRNIVAEHVQRHTSNKKCGFEFRLEQIEARQDDILCLKVQGDVVPLGQKIKLLKEHF